MALPRTIRLGHEEAVITEIFPTYIAQWYLYFLGLVILGATAFFASWLLSRGWMGYTLGSIGLLLAAYILLKARHYNRHAYWVLTTLRLIDVAKTGLWRELVTSLTYSKIDDVLIEKRGISAMLMNHGRVIVKVVDDDMVYTLDNIRQPERVQHLLLEYKDGLVARRERQSVKDIFQSVLKTIPNLSDAQLVVLEKQVQDALDKRLGR